MSQLIKECRTGGHGLVCLASPPEILPDLSKVEWDLFKAQGFVWYKDFVAFAPRGDQWSYSVRIYLSDELTLQSGMDRAILLPYTVPDEGILFVTGSYGNPNISFEIAPGNYKLLFETRFLTDEEITSSGEYDFLLENLNNPEVNFYDERRPELCLFTFIPTNEKVKPEILYPTYESIVEKLGVKILGTTKIFYTGLDPRTELVLHDRPRPEGYE
jgi:hypothetical protein